MAQTLKKSPLSRRAFLGGIGVAGLGALDLTGCSTAAAGTDAYRAVLSEDDDRWVDTILSTMSLADKCDQLVMGPVCMVAGEIAVKEGGEGLERGFEEAPLGGVVIDKGNVASESQVTALCDNVRVLSSSSGGLACAFIAMNRDGVDLLGRVSVGKGFTSLTAEEIPPLLREVGVNLYLGPDLDPSAHVNDGLTSEDLVEKAERMAVLCESSLIVDCPMGFPGTKATALGASDDGVDALVAPFAQAVDRGAAMVGFGDFEMRDGVPATLDAEWIGYLRETLGFEGVILSGVVDYAAGRAGMDLFDACLEFLDAGGDLLYVDGDPIGVAGQLAGAVRDGRISEERIEESARRILEVKVTKNVQQF